MIFTDDRTQKVLNGQKTVTRRIWREGDILTSDPAYLLPRRINTSALMRVNVRGKMFAAWKVLGYYPVQDGRGKHSLGKIQLLTIELDWNVLDISPSEVKAEGFDNIWQFTRAWMEMHDKKGFAMIETSYLGLLNLAEARQKLHPELYKAWRLGYECVQVYDVK